MGEHARYLGPVEHDSPLLRSAYAACSSFCLPSTLETPGLAALEAAAAGASLVITEEGSTREYFGDDALYVRSDDVEGIASALIAASGAPRSSALMERVNTRFTWHQAADALVDLYRRLLEKA
jgi:glycosyltransferase involved in cell wall biosynthesis